MLPPPGYDRVGRPCIHNNYIYSSFRRSGTTASFAVYRLQVSDIDGNTDAWQYVQMLPGGNLHRDIYLFFYSDCLHCIICVSWQDAYCVYQLNPTDGWCFITSLPCRVFNFGMVLVDYHLLIVGGFDFHSKPLSSVLAFHLGGLSRVWEFLHDLPFACRSPIVVRQDSFVHVLTFRPRQRKVASMYVSEGVHRGSWACDILPNVPRLPLGAVVMSGYLVVVCASHCYVYSAKYHTFLELSASSDDEERFFCLSHGNALFAFSSLLRSRNATCVLSI